MRDVQWYLSLITMGNDVSYTATKGASLKSLDKALRLLMELARMRGSGAASVGELARNLRLHKSTVSRILQSLKAYDLVTRDRNGPYRIGPGVLLLANSYQGDFDLRRILRPHLEQVVRDLGQTATLVIRRQNVAICIDRIAATSNVHLTMKIGGVYPLHAGATTRVLLAYMDGEELEAIDWENLEAITDKTVTERKQLEALSAETRANGFALSLGERTIGAGSVAVPILDNAGYCLASLGVSGPVQDYMIDARVQGTIDALSYTAAAVSMHAKSWWGQDQDEN